MQPKVRLADIARASDVSASTVSLVLRNKPGIPAETRRRVLEAAARLGYQRPEPASADSAPQVLHNLGLIIKADAGESPQANPFYSQVMAGIEDACRSKHINLLYATLPVDADNVPVAMPRLLSEQSVDGLLLVGAFVDATLDQVLGASSLPVILVDAYPAADQVGSRFDAVLTDNVRGARQAVEYLIACGHRCIGMVGGGGHAYPSLRERREGYLQALRAAGMTCAYFADCSPEAVEEAVTGFLRTQPEVTALFAVNDRAAIAALRAAQAVGLRVPEELSIMGFDDIDLAAHVMPALTTMHVDKVGMGRLAVQLLEARLAFPQSEQVTSVLRPRLVVRESVRRLAAGNPDAAATVLDSTTPTPPIHPANDFNDSPFPASQFPAAKGD